ncbi:MAG TPA: transglycosylase SLT domain-containing protein [Pyrinomonadaceae bacterium]|nr:transglycosylase SLT domain-containing protein [Pyrinomonadaceae bacterium]
MQFLSPSLLSLALLLGTTQPYSPSLVTKPGDGSLVGTLATIFQSAHDGTLASIRRSDRESRDTNNKLRRLSAAEHLRRANVYMSNRAFDEARAHWQALIDYYPQEAKVPEALLGIGRSYYQSRRYSEAFTTFEQLARNYDLTKEGREGLNFSAAALLRMGRPSEAVQRYIDYINKFPTGERIDTAHLNVIDGLREAGRPQDAIMWVGRTRQRFAGTATDTNALFARLRLDVAEGDWRQAVSTANELATQPIQKGVLTTPAEVTYLKAYSLERLGNRRDAVSAYLAIPDSANSYYGWLAGERLERLAEGETRNQLSARSERARKQIADAAADYPAPYRQAILKTARRQKLDPRFILAIIRQESVFRHTAKSPAGARGLLQLTIDAARKYAAAAGFNSVSESELYRPEVSIRLGGEYLGELSRLFPNMLEAAAASYNGGEDNVARWVRRTKHKDPGAFTAEIGFEETKGYVQKVMANYRAYQQLYTADLVPR